MELGKFRFGRRSEELLAKAHPELVRLARWTLHRSPVDFGITETLRTMKKQLILVEQKASWTTNSRHLTGHALDFACWVDFDGDGRLEIRWDYGLYVQVGEVFKYGSRELKIPITWGGDWKSRDAVHVELDWKAYPPKQVQKDLI